MTAFHCEEIVISQKHTQRAFIGAFRFCSLHVFGLSCRSHYQAVPASRRAHSRFSSSAASVLQLSEVSISYVQPRSRWAPPFSLLHLPVAASISFLLMPPPHPASTSSLQCNQPRSWCVPSCHLSCELIELIGAVLEKQAEVWSIIKLKENTESLGVLYVCLSYNHKPQRWECEINN